MPPTGEELRVDGTAASSYGLERKSAYSVIRQQIEKYEEIVRAANESLSFWRSRHNTLAYISRLPPEVLVNIFMFLVYDNDPLLNPLAIRDVKEPRDYFNKPRWITVTHVCSQWRQAALNSPSLWTRPCFGHPTVANEIIARAKHALLISGIALPDSAFWPDRTGETLLFDNLHRTRELTIMVGQQTSSRVPELRSNLKRPAPQLEAFTLHVDIQQTGRECIFSSQEDLFSGNHPKLQALLLQNWAIAWNQPIARSFEGLRLLSLGTSGGVSIDQDSPRIRISVFISALAFLPCLEGLTLHHTFLRLNSDDLEWGAKFGDIVLPSLKELDIKDFFETCELVFSHISCPRHTSFGVEGESYQSAGLGSLIAAERTSADVLRSLEHQFKEPPIRLKIRYYPAELSLAVSIRCEEQMKCTARNTGYISLPKVELECTDCFLYLREQASSICHLPLFNKIVDLEFRSVEIDEDTWQHLGTLHDLRYITIKNDCDPTLLLDALILRTDSAGRNSSNRQPTLEEFTVQFYFERLEQLTFKDCNYERVVGPKHFECLQIRGRHGYGPGFLDFYGCAGVTKEQFATLEDYIDVYIESEV